VLCTDLYMTAAESTGGQHSFGSADANASCRFDSCCRFFNIHLFVLVFFCKTLRAYSVPQPRVSTLEEKRESDSVMSGCHCSEANNVTKMTYRLRTTSYLRSECAEIINQYERMVTTEVDG
jgi:hypothetical protein